MMEPCLEPVDKERLLKALAAIVKSRGHEPLRTWPILLPTDEFFPDPWKEDLESAALLLQRLMGYAGLNLPAELVPYDRSIALFHSNTPAWFGGIQNDKFLFGINPYRLRDSQILIASLCHEVAQAYRHFYKVAGDGTLSEEELTDLTTIFLGFGIFTTNATDRYRQGGRYVSFLTSLDISYISLGYLPAREMSFLLAVQFEARCLSRSAVVSLCHQLEPNQQEYLKDEWSNLPAHCELLSALGISGIEFPEGLLSSDRPQPVASNERMVSIREHVTAVKWNSGRPVYRVKSTRSEHYAMVAFLGGIILLALAGIWALRSYAVFPVAVVVSVYILYRVGKAPDRCSGSFCGVRLAPEENTCPQCGGNICGRIRSPRDKLDIEEERFLTSFEKATQEGTEALVKLGHSYHFGEAVDPDDVRAFECYEKAAQLGSVDGMLCTADHFRNGDGVEADIDLAIHWYTKAMEFEKTWSTFALGVIYGCGEDVALDLGKAILYMQMAKENGNALAEGWLRYLSAGAEDLPARPS